MILGHPALRLLARRKFVGALRKQVRRLKTVQGLVFAVIGFSALALWIGTALANSVMLGARSAGPTVDEGLARLVGLTILGMSLIGALSFRGLYLPREEIELLFAAPLRRSDVIRYRLLNSLGKSLLGALFFAVIVMGRVGEPLHGFVGGFVAMMTVPIAAQAVSLLAGDAENRWIGKLPRGALRVANVIGVLAILSVFLLPSSGERPDVEASTLVELARRAIAHPVVQALTLVVWPWTRLAITTSSAEFLGLLALCVALWLGAFELCARMRIDYRELSLETSADVARRLSRLRRGAGGASAGSAPANSAGWRIPWLFGRGPFGALAWRKTGTMLRKARGTLLISGALVTVLILVTRFLFAGDSRESVLAASGLIAAAGTAYLCAGLRFDFREDLDRMDVVRSWPIAPWRVFLATLLPEVAVVSAFLSVAILVRASLSGHVPVEVFAILAALGPTVLAWVSIDNLVFLLWPQRLTPGSEGLLQQAGRSMLLMLLRVLLVGASAGTALGLGWLLYLATESLAAAVLLALLVTFLECVLIVFLGGKALARFDVARDR